MSVNNQAAQWLFSALLAVVLSYISFVLRSYDARMKDSASDRDALRALLEVRTKESLDDRASLWAKAGDHGEKIATLVSGQASTDRRLERIETKLDVLLGRQHGS